VRSAAVVLLALLLLGVSPILAPARGADVEFYATSTSTTLGTPAGTVSQLQAVDGSSMTIVEADAGGSSGSAVMLPDGVVGGNYWESFFRIPLCSSGTAQWACLDELPHDSNTTYVSDTATGNPQTGLYTVGPWTGGAVSITSVSSYAWVRKNQSADAALVVGVDWNGLGPEWQCAPMGSGIESQAYFNLTTGIYADRCDGNPGWTVADLDDLIVRVQANHVVNLAIHEALTSAGVIVNWANYAYDLATTYTWDTIDDARATTLAFAASSSDSETFSVQAQTCGSGTWTTVGAVSGTSIALRTVEIAGFVCGSALTVRFVSDTVTGDATQTTLTLDYLALQYNSPGIEPPIVQATISCAVEGTPPALVRCAASEYTTAPAASRTWRFAPAVEDLVVTSRIAVAPFQLVASTACFGLPFLDPGDCQEVTFGVPPWWTFNLHQWNVSYTVNVFTRSATAWTIVSVDYRPLILLVVGVVVLVVGVVASRRIKEPKKETPSGPPDLGPREKEEGNT